MTLQLIKISTTAYEEEDFFLVTDLSEAYVLEIIHPIVWAEREGEEDYDNEILFNALKKAYPKNFIEVFYEPNTLIL